MDHNIKNFFDNSFVFKPYLHTGKPLNQTSYIYKELCDNFIKTPKITILSVITIKTELYIKVIF